MERGMITCVVDPVVSVGVPSEVCAANASLKVDAVVSSWGSLLMICRLNSVVSRATLSWGVV